MESKGTLIGEVVNHIATVLENLQSNKDVTDNVQSTLKGKFNDVLRYLDTKKDRDVFKPLLQKLQA